MTAFDTSRPTTALNTGRITAVFTNMIGAITTWNDARVTRNALSKLSARELDDIGLTSSDLNTVHTIIR